MVSLSHLSSSFVRPISLASFVSSSYIRTSTLFGCLRRLVAFSRRDSMDACRAFHAKTPPAPSSRASRPPSIERESHSDMRRGGKMRGPSSSNPPPRTPSQRTENMNVDRVPQSKPETGKRTGLFSSQYNSSNVLDVKSNTLQQRTRSRAAEPSLFAGNDSYSNDLSDRDRSSVSPLPVIRRGRFTDGDEGEFSSTLERQMGRRFRQPKSENRRSSDRDSSYTSSKNHQGRKSAMRYGDDFSPPKSNHRHSPASKATSTSSSAMQDDRNRGDSSLNEMNRLSSLLRAQPNSAIAKAAKRKLEALLEANPTLAETFHELSRTSSKKDSFSSNSIHERKDAGPRKIILGDHVTVRELAQGLGLSLSETRSALSKLDFFADRDESIVPINIAESISLEYNVDPVRSEEVFADLVPSFQKRMDLPHFPPRAPVVTVMGHVDHGKTSLLDALRNTSVAAGEHGGITQAIGAFQVYLSNHKSITFIDTPGHAAFTSMRARGAKVTDIVLLLVAADDGVMPQTKEAISHAQAANVPMIAVINKIDKPEADPERVERELLSAGVITESYGGDIQVVHVSAAQGIGLVELEEAILLQSEILQLTADREGHGEAVIIESRLDRNVGPVVDCIVHCGTLRVGDCVVAGSSWGRIRAMHDSQGKNIQCAEPSSPVEIIGLRAVPEAGVELLVVDSEERAKQVVEERSKRDASLALRRHVESGASSSSLVETNTSDIGMLSTEELAKKGPKQVNMIIKGDVAGSVDAIIGSLHKLPQDEIKLNVLLAAVGNISETDVSLAAVSKSLIVGFNVRIPTQIVDLAKQRSVPIRSYRIIYELMDDLSKHVSEMLDPRVEELVSGVAEIQKLFEIKKKKEKVVVAGCRVQEGTMHRSSTVRVYRNDESIFEGGVAELKLFKESVTSISRGQECGVALDGFSDLRVGDLIKCIEFRHVPRKVEFAPY